MEAFFRRLEENGFDFSLPHKIDFQIDFDEWPPSVEALVLLKQEYPNVELMQFSIFDHLTYELVTNVQARVSSLLKSYGGTCECWGVLSDRPRKGL